MRKRHESGSAGATTTCTLTNTLVRSSATMGRRRTLPYSIALHPDGALPKGRGKVGESAGARLAFLRKRTRRGGRKEN